MTTRPYSLGKAVGNTAWTLVAEVTGTDISASLNVRFSTTNRAADIKIRVAIVPASFNLGIDTPSNDQWIQPIDIVIGPSGAVSGIIEDSGIILLNGYKIVAKTDALVVSSRAHGFVRTGA